MIFSLLSDQVYVNAPTIIQPNPRYLGIQNSTDAFYFCFSIFMLFIAIGMLIVVKTSVSEENVSL